MFIHTKRHFVDIWVVEAAAAMGVMLLREVRFVVGITLLLQILRMYRCLTLALLFHPF
jgi:hypothetical protein